MAQKKKKWVLFKSTTTIPANIAGTKEDKRLPKGECENLPEGYANFLITSGLAEICDEPKKTTKKTTPVKTTKKTTKKTTPVKTTQKADADAAKKLEEAQGVVDGIAAKMEEMSEGDDGWAELTAQLNDARTALAELQTSA
ncbi:hypothetical protein RKLH11_2045 [Rhodobacteraceae bacterium KLH11]|nr:hypothetical protein RKLH11_2045 [Rhodobacteraceae bacterium KLH11]